MRLLRLWAVGSGLAGGSLTALELFASFGIERVSRTAIPPIPRPPVAVLVETLAGLIAVRVFAFRL